MSTRMIRTLALAAGAGALVLGAAAPAMADDLGVGASKVSVASGAPAANFEVAFDQAAPTAPCPTTVTTWVAKTASKNMKAIVVAPTATCTPGATGGVITVNIAAPAGAKKKNAVVKVIGTSTTDATVKVVKTIVVKVTGTAKPGNGPKN